MKHKEKSWKRRWITHLICLLVLAGSVFLLYLLSRDSSFLYALQGSSYAATQDFGYHFAKDVEKAIRYTNLRQKLEYEGTLDPDYSGMKYETTEGVWEFLPLREIIQYGESLGIYFDENHSLIVDSDVISTEENGQIPDDGTDEETFLEYLEQSKTFSDDREKNIAMLNFLYEVEEYYTLQEELGLTGNPTNFSYRFIYVNDDKKSIVSSNLPGNENVGDILSRGAFFQLDSRAAYLTYNFNTNALSQMYYTVYDSGLTQYAPYEIVAGVNTSYPQSDSYYAAALRYQNLQWKMFLLAGSIALMELYLLVSLIGMCRHIPQKRPFFQHWRTEVLLAVWGVFAAVLIWSGVYFVAGFSNARIGRVITGLIVFCLSYTPMLAGGFVIVQCLRTGEMAEHSLLVKLARDVRKGYWGIHERREGSRGVLFMILGYFILNFLPAVGLGYLLFKFRTEGSINHGEIAGAVFCGAVLLLLNAAVFIYYAKKLIQGNRIMSAVKQISGGEIGTQIDTEEMSGNEKLLAQSINAIGEGLSKAVEEQTKSERLKTDLIANVSHDLRTPLTSIISYVDLIKREGIPNEKVQNYLDILERKSQRLKNLTEDLVDASKISSGNMPVNWERIDLVQMVNQMEGEFQEKFARADLQPVTKIEEPPVYVQADGRLLFRVLENLYNNACKYAMPGTRVYIDLKQILHKAVFTMKNVSADQLNIPAEELTERFIRGDVARTTEGSGLGLSIAQSMTELLGGSFEIYLEGDLFRVRLIFSVDEI